MTIVRDRFNVPHITGNSRDDVTWAMGWVLQRGPRAAARPGPRRRRGWRRSTRPTSTRSAWSSACKPVHADPAGRPDDPARRRSRALRAAGARRQGACCTTSTSTSQGLNARLKAEGSDAKPWTRVDVFAANAHRRRRSSARAAATRRARSQFLSALRKRYGNAQAAQRMFDDFTEFDDPDAPSTMTKTFPYGKAIGVGKRQRRARRRLVQADRSEGPRRRAASAHPRWASNFLIVGAQALGDRAPAVRRRPADRLLLPRPDARGRHQLARACRRAARPRRASRATS